MIAIGFIPGIGDGIKTIGKRGLGYLDNNRILKQMGEFLGENIIAPILNLVGDLTAPIVNQIKHAIRRKLDEAQEIARRLGEGADNVLDDVTGQPQPRLATEGAGNVSPNQIDNTNQPRQNEPLQSTGSPGGSLPNAITSAIGSNVANKLVDEFDVNTVRGLFEKMNQPTLHQMSLAASIKKVGLQEFINLVKSNSADGMIKYGAEALQKIGLADLDKTGSISSTVVNPKKLQKKWKHAVDFGITTSYKATDTAAHAQFKAALNDVVANADEVYIGPYHGSNAVHFFKSGKLVITDISGNFISGWANVSSKLSGIKSAAPPSGSSNFQVK